MMAGYQPKVTRITSVIKEAADFLSAAFLLGVLTGGDHETKKPKYHPHIGIGTSYDGFVTFYIHPHG
jgi:hypothetical protein